MSEHSEHDLLRELFPETAREWFGDHPTPRETLGLYAVADGRMALVSGAQLAEFTPLDPKGNKVLHCDLCHYTRSRSEAAVYRVLVSSRRTRYMTLCFGTESCQGRAGKEGVRQFAERIFPIESLYAE
ncbi:hypothetical protein EHF33_00555 [Deinococcus psychrotolerans]|uniref:Elongation factor G-binding protein C-terminal treble-clef zinc-finger domain-containing protein n=1 Tax=Deinococcus psychrotolerans TaxID=2489213 RepID=A0A3G8Y7U3_9DEIO|nr:hypothetical protein [Deinococcus psychrotolerans]AZI41428.1 hypothetical protein EHF33_00555 [Deinococcus psychrotolerans]